MKGKSLTQRTLYALRQEGYVCGMVERYLMYAGSYGKKQDLFGIFDIIGMTSTCIAGIQSCSGAHFAAHDRTILGSKYAVLWLEAGGRIELWGWRKVKYKKGGKLMIWKPRRKIYSLTDFVTE